MKNYIYLLLLIPLLSLSQESKFRVINKDLDTIFTSKMNFSNNGEIVEMDNIIGGANLLNSKDIFSIRKEVDGWEYFNWTKSEFTDFIVVEIDSISKQDLFNKTINWIKDNYKNPDEVIKTTIDNSKIRMEGYGSNIIKYKGWGVLDIPGKYIIEISFRDGKYKFDPLGVTYILDQPIGEVPILISDTSQYYKNRKGEINNMFKYFPLSVENLFNDLNKSLYDYILNNKDENLNNDDW